MQNVIHIFHLIVIILYIILFTSILTSFIANTDNQYVYFLDTKIDMKCAYRFQTGCKCGSCGLTRGWINISHLRIKEAQTLNENSILSYVCTIMFLISSTTYYFFRSNIKKRLLATTGLLIILIIGWSDIIKKNIELKTYSSVATK